MLAILFHRSSPMYDEFANPTRADMPHLRLRPALALCLRMYRFRDISRLAILRLVLTALLVLQGNLSATAMAGMDASRLSSPPSLDLVICTPDGIKSVSFPSPGNDASHEDCDCPCGSLCSAKTPAANGTDGTGSAIPNATVDGHNIPVVRTVHAPHGPGSGRPGSPRAPPQAV